MLSIICCICIELSRPQIQSNPSTSSKSLLESCSFPCLIAILRGMESLSTHACMYVCMYLILEPFLCLNPSYPTTSSPLSFLASTVELSTAATSSCSLMDANSLSILSHTPSSSSSCYLLSLLQAVL
jgi:hypothetical protein